MAGTSLMTVLLDLFSICPSIRLIFELFRYFFSEYSDQRLGRVSQRRHVMLAVLGGPLFGHSLDPPSGMLDI
jgi:hypothetical protein